MALRENFSDGLRKQVEDISERMGALEHSEDYIQYRIAAYRSRLSLFEDAVNNTSNSEVRCMVYVCHVRKSKDFKNIFLFVIQILT